MDAATKGFWDKVVRELEHLNKTLDELLEIVERPRQQHGPAPEDKSSATDEADAAGGKMPLQLHIRPSPEHQAKPNKKWHHTLQGWKIRLEIIGIGFAILYALVTGWIAYINYHQWQDSHRSFEDARKHFEYDERSWAKIFYACPKGEFLKLPVAPSCDLTITNTGKSVITVLHGVATMEIVAKESGPSFTKPFIHASGNIFTKGPIFPTDSDVYPIFLEDSDYTPRQFSQKESDDLISGASYIATWGYLAYRDSFGTHWYKFCNWKTYVETQHTEVNSIMCTKFNEVGEGETPPGFEAMAW